MRVVRATRGSRPFAFKTFWLYIAVILYVLIIEFTRTPISPSHGSSEHTSSEVTPGGEKDNGRNEEVSISSEGKVDDDEEEEEMNAKKGISKVPFNKDFFLCSKWYGADDIWNKLIGEGTETMKKNNYTKHLVSFEVGAYHARQSLNAARAQFHTHVFEPSPSSFERIQHKMNQLTEENPELKNFIHLHNVAAGSTTGDILDFQTTGGIGDHVGEFDTWNMKPGKVPDDFPENKKGKMIQVSSMKLDDLITLHDIENEDPIDEIYAMKIDTQGFEPQVFAGLEESIRNHKIKYLLTEYWPNGMALHNNRTDKCNLAMEMLNPIISANYSIYALPISVHGSIRNAQINDWEERPFDDLRADCEYLLQLEKRFPNVHYRIGYWTEYFFVAPDARPLELN